MSKWIWKSETRYYMVRLQLDLFGDWMLTKNWGGLNNRLGGAQVQTFKSMEEAFGELKHVEKIRGARGYELQAPYQPRS